MREPWEWNKADLDALISDQRPEGLHLDYKWSEALSRDSKSVTEITKDVSSFANADGGTIVYGMIEKARGGPPEGFDNGVDAAELSREWLDSIVANRIWPRLTVQINPVPLDAGRVIYVVHIPKGKTAHMADDKHYHTRRPWVGRQRGSR